MRDFRQEERQRVKPPQVEKGKGASASTRGLPQNGAVAQKVNKSQRISKEVGKVINVTKSNRRDRSKGGLDPINSKINALRLEGETPKKANGAFKIQMHEMTTAQVHSNLGKYQSSIEEELLSQGIDADAVEIDSGKHLLEDAVFSDSEESVKASDAEANEGEEPQDEKNAVSLFEFLKSDETSKVYVKGSIQGVFPDQKVTWVPLTQDIPIGDASWVEATKGAEVRLIRTSSRGLAKLRISNVVKSDSTVSVLRSPQGALYSLVNNSNFVSS